MTTRDDGTTQRKGPLALCTTMLVLGGCGEDVRVGHQLGTDALTTGTPSGAEASGSDSADPPGLSSDASSTPGSSSSTDGSSSGSTTSTVGPEITEEGSSDGVRFDLWSSGDSTAGGDDGTKQGCDKIDFLFVVDNSGSMGAHQTALINSFGPFIDTIYDRVQATDFQIMVTDSDTDYDVNRCDQGCPDHAWCGDWCTAQSGLDLACEATLGAGEVAPYNMRPATASAAYRTVNAISPRRFRGTRSRTSSPVWPRSEHWDRVRSYR